MTPPSVILDLSCVVRHRDLDDWSIVERVVRAWRDQRDPKAVFYGVADNSLWHRMDESGKAALRQWQRKGRARSVSYADEDILDLAEADPASVVITHDLYRDLRRKYPWLQGSDRFFVPVHQGDSLTFAQNDMVPIEDHEVSRRAEAAYLKPLGLVSPEARQVLLSEWACDNRACMWSGAPIIGTDPAYRDGNVFCPECRAPARRVGDRGFTREIVLHLGDNEVERIPIAEDTRVVFGRGRGEDRYDVRELLVGEDAALVSRDHLAVSNQGGKVRVEDLGSKNGSVLLRPDQNPAPLTAGILQVLAARDRISLAAGAFELRLSGKQRPRGRYEPDLHSPPPWATDATRAGPS